MSRNPEAPLINSELIVTSPVKTLPPGVMVAEWSADLEATHTRYLKLWDGLFPIEISARGELEPLARKVMDYVDSQRGNFTCRKAIQIMRCGDSEFEPADLAEKIIRFIEAEVTDIYLIKRIGLAYN